MAPNTFSYLIVYGVLTLGIAATVLHLRHLRKVGIRQNSHRFVKKNLLTGNEIEFMGRLERAVGNDFKILAQVSMGAIMDTKLTSEHPDYWEVRNSYSSKIIDYVLCDPKTLEPLLIVELDDIMHDFDKDRKRDALVARCGLATARFWSRNKPSVPHLRQQLLSRLSRP